MNILVVDDDKILRKGLKVIIENNTHHIIIGEAKNGKEALQLLQSENFADIVITDVKMPVLDGLGLLAEAQRTGIQSKFIVLSGYDDYVYVRQALTIGAADYLLKPIDKATLLEVLKRLELELELERRNLEQESRIQGIMGDSVEILQEKLLKELIGVEPPGLRSREERMKDFGLHRANNFSLAVLKMDSQYDETENAAFCESPLTYIGVLKDLIRTHSESFLFNEKVITSLAARNIVVLFYTDASTANSMENVVPAFLHALQADFTLRTKLTFTAGLSKPFDHMDHMVKAYTQADVAADNRFYEGMGKVIGYDAIKCKYITDKLENNQIMLQLQDAIEMCDANQSKKLCQELMDMVEASHAEPAYAKEYIVRIFSSLCMENEKFREVCILFANERLDIPKVIQYMDTLQGIRQYITDAVPKAIAVIRNMRKAGSKGIVDNAKDYIRMHFHEDISLRDVASQVHLNPNYLSELFKSETGQNFVDYLIEVRMNTAKKLLGQHNIKIYEVGFMVGYNEPVSFNRAFKKVVGVTPTEYRKLVLA